MRIEHRAQYVSHCNPRYLVIDSDVVVLPVDRRVLLYFFGLWKRAEPLGPVDLMVEAIVDALKAILQVELELVDFPYINMAVSVAVKTPRFPPSVDEVFRQQESLVWGHVQCRRKGSVAGALGLSPMGIGESCEGWRR